MTYFGTVWGSAEQRRLEARRMINPAARALEALRVAGLQSEIVSGGSTSAAEFSGDIPGLTEIRPGTYVHNDLNTYYQGACRLDDCAARRDDRRFHHHPGPRHGRRGLENSFLRPSQLRS